MKMNAQYFIDKFSKIPAKHWTTRTYRDCDDDSVRCVLGHCGVGYYPQAKTDYLEHNKEAQALIRLFDNLDFWPAYVNDGSGHEGMTLHKRFAHKDSVYRDLGKTPKQRILNVLNQLKEKGL